MKRNVDAGNRVVGQLLASPVDSLHRRIREVIFRGALAACILAAPGTLRAQELPAQSVSPVDGFQQSAAKQAELQVRVEKLEAEVAELKRLLRGPAAGPIESAVLAKGGGPEPLAASADRATAIQENSAQAKPGTVGLAGITADDRKELDFLHGTTVDVTFDGYYSYNFNAPVGRVNLLRAYDVLSNNFSLNQADVIFEHAPDLSEGRRWGARVDLQFGQATDTLQGNPLNEPRPDIYRNIFQAYGTYIVPMGRGLTVDFGKWSSSIGIEGNYTKDQMNYSRSYYFNFLPFYHTGARANYAVNDRLTLTYWVVNGTNQSEATNGFKDELFGFAAKPAKSLTWVVNYYLGQEHPDRVEVAPTSPIPVQPGLSFAAIRPAPNGRLHIFDSYISWQARPKLSFALEGDYVIQRLWREQATGESDAPSHVIGGAGYVRYELSPRIALAGRAEYLSDRGGLFSGLTQALKEATGTLDYTLNEGFLMRYEWRRDFSNQRSFLTDTQGLLSKEQTTASVGLIWWWGRKEATW